MSTYTQILYQIVFSTKNREHSLAAIHREELYRYIWGVLQNQNCHLYRIGASIIVTQVHPSVSLAELIKDIKISTLQMIKSENMFPNFTRWQEGYGAFTYAYSAKNSLITYVKRQEEHHKKVSFCDEYIRLLKEHGIEFDEKYLF
ncbi:MAG: transposase [Salinivirgaceae bacterium]|nr:transposase [Salinivirgaceae bacterium]